MGWGLRCKYCDWFGMGIRGEYWMAQLWLNLRIARKGVLADKGWFLNGTRLWKILDIRCVWSWWWTGRPGVLQLMGSQRVRHDWMTELNWTELKLRLGDFLVAQTVMNLPAMQETQVQFLSQEDPLEKGMATHSSIIAWRIPRTEKPGMPQSMGSQRVGLDWATNTFTFTNLNWLVNWKLLSRVRLLRPDGL